MDYWDGVQWESLHQPIRTMDNVPPHVQHAVAELRGALAAGAACQGGTPGSAAAHAKALVFADKLLFTVTRRARGGKKGQRGETASAAICRRLRLAWGGQWGALFAEAARAEPAAGQGASRTEAQRLADDVQAIQCAIDDGDARSALRRVDGHIDMAPEAKALAVLPGLFPKASKPLPALRVAEPTPADVEHFKRELRGCFLHAPPRRGAGPGGGKHEHWSWMPKYEEPWHQLQEFCLCLALGRVPGDIVGALASARVLAGDREEADKVRPFALGVVLRRLVNKAKARTFRSRVAAALAPHEHSLGGGGSAELMHKTALSHLDSHPASAIRSFDVSNAHNEFERADALEAIAQECPDLLPWASPELIHPAVHIYIGPSGEPLRLCKDRGGDQGDAMVSIVFPLTYKKVVRETEAAAQAADPSARAYSYSDDLDVVCDPAAGTLASAAFHSGCARIGLRANASKETIATGRDVDIANLPGGAKVVARPTVLRHGAPTPVPALPATNAASGSQLAEGSPEVDGLHRARATFYARLNVLVAAGLPAHLAAALLQLRTNSDYIFLARACGIPLTDAQRLDGDLERQIQRLYGVTAWSARAGRQTALSGKAGGMGFKSVAATAPACYTASWHACAGKVAHRLGLSGVPALVTQSLWAATVCDSCTPILRRTLHSDTAELGDQAHTLTQHTITAGAADAAREALLSELAGDPAGRADFRSAGGPGAAAWLKLPTRPSHHLTDRQFTIAAHLRLRLDVPGCCGRCQHRARNGQLCNEPLDAKGAHARTCPVGGWRMRKHDACCGALKNWLEEMGCHVDVEVVMPTAANGLDEPRMDLIVRAPGVLGPIHIDVTVVSATSREALKRGSADREEVTADLGAARKRQTYSNIAVVPFVLEESGRLGADALSLVRKLAPREHAARTEALNELYQSLAATLQRAAANSAIAAMDGAARTAAAPQGAAAAVPGIPQGAAAAVPAGAPQGAAAAVQAGT